MSDYWKSEQYLGAGFVFQRKYTEEGDEALLYFHRNINEWSSTKPSFGHNHDGTKAQERIVHISETDISVEVSDEMMLELSESEDLL